jgi:hypothetical protein
MQHHPYTGRASKFLRITAENYYLWDKVRGN